MSRNRSFNQNSTSTNSSKTNQSIASNINKNVINYSDRNENKNTEADSEKVSVCFL